MGAGGANAIYFQFGPERFTSYQPKYLIGYVEASTGRQRMEKQTPEHLIIGRRSMKTVGRQNFESPSIGRCTPRGIILRSS
jgi:hypothetical protein